MFNNIPDNNLFQYSVLLIVVILLFLYSKYKNKKKFNKHEYNQKLATKIINKINDFEHSGQKINYLRKIDPFVFEELLLNAYKEKGYKIVRNKRYTGDGGLDGTMYDSKGRKIIIQAKRYSNYIKPSHVRDFALLVINNNAYSGYFIHTGRASVNTRNEFINTNVKIIGGSELITLLQ